VILLIILMRGYTHEPTQLPGDRGASTAA